MKESKRLFNKALFVQALKSNYISYLVVALGNAFILLVVTLILSTLSINVTRDSMANMFNSANLERQIKEAGVSLYLSYTEGIDAYTDTLPLLGDNMPFLYDGLKEINKAGYGGYDTQLRLIEKAYKTSYEASLEEDETLKHSNAKETTIKSADIILNLAGKDERMIEAINLFLNKYLDNYHEGKDDLIKISLNESLKEFIVNQGEFTEEQINIVLDGINKIFNLGKVDDLKNQIINVIDEITDNLATSIVDFYTIDVPTEIICEGYLSNKDYFINNTILEGETVGYRDALYIEMVASVMGELFKDNYYLEALPTFKVEYLTNERGIPYYLDESGKEVLIEDVKDKDKLVEVKSGMEKKANILEKQYKEILTGEKYTKEEIDKAKKSASAFYKIGHMFATNFLTHYVQNKDVYFNEETHSVNEEPLIDRISLDLKEIGTPYLLNMFKVSSLDEITKDKFGLDGNELINKVYDYSTGSIAVFKSEYKKSLDKNYDYKTSLLVALVKASDTLTDQLPEDIYIKLYDLSSRNLYGLVIGAMFFSLAGLLLPMVYTILTSNSLVSEEVETGSLAFTLSCPVNRTSIVFTKAIYQIVSITTMFLILFGIGVLTRQVAIWTGGSDFATSVSVKDLALYTLGAYSVIMAIGAICFFTSCYFNKTKYSLGVGGGLAIFFYVTSILGLFGLNVMPLALKIDSMNIFNYMTIIRFFDVQAILDGDVVFYYELIGLLLITVIGYGASFYVFNKKDLPL